MMTRLPSHEPRPIVESPPDDRARFVRVIDLFVRLEQRESLAQFEDNT
jgi:hypothetical protein